MRTSDNARLEMRSIADRRLSSPAPAILSQISSTTIAASSRTSTTPETSSIISGASLEMVGCILD